MLFAHLITEIDAKLFESIELEYLEACNVQDADEDRFLHGVVDERGVALLHDEAEHAPVQTARDARHGLVALVDVLTLGHPLGAHLDICTDADHGISTNGSGRKI